MRLAELAKALDCEVRGNGEIEIERVAPIESAGRGDLTFVANPRYVRYLVTTKASAVIVSTGAPEVSIPSLRTADPYLAFARAVEHFYEPPRMAAGIHASAVIASTAEIGPGSSVGPYSVIGDNVRIGRDARIGPHVVIYPEVTIGDRFSAHAHVTVRERVRVGSDVILQSGAVVGSDGFGYLPTQCGTIERLIQAGDVVLEDKVEIGANTTVDRATVGSTIIRRGAKLDNLVMVAHGCEVGEHTMVAAQVGMAGSTRVGDWVRMGGQVGTAGHLSIGDGAQIGGQTGVTRSVAAGAAMGSVVPAMEASLHRRVMGALSRLPDLLRRVRRLEKRLFDAEGRGRS